LILAIHVLCAEYGGRPSSYIGLDPVSADAFSFDIYVCNFGMTSRNKKDDFVDSDQEINLRG